MIHKFIRRLNDWYNSSGRRVRLRILAGFCMAFLLLLWLAVGNLHFDTNQFTTSVPVHIGKASGPAVTGGHPKNKR